MKTLVWFRDDLRIQDNPALSAGENITALYILENEGRKLGGAVKWWLHYSLLALSNSLKTHGIQLILREGKAKEIIDDLVKDHGFTHLNWNRRYTKAGIEIDREIKATAKCEVTSFNGNLLQEPWEIKEYKVFTPFWRAHQTFPSRDLVILPDLKGNPLIASDELDDLNLLPTTPNWAAGFVENCGEAHALKRLEGFIENGLVGYSGGRDRPDLNNVSRLAPYLRFGEISPTQIFHRLSFLEETRDITKFKAEIGWREFANHLLFHNPDLAWRNFNVKFDAFPFTKDDQALIAWQKGETGYPIVDAGMRELWQTGYMHNRVRMIVASFLIKHLLIDWREGEKWFWDCLMDADPANNSASWQWVAGSGADASPYFRIFNPIIQGEKFDPNGDYVLKYLPQLKAVPIKYLHKPWESPYPVAGYPAPIVVHERARARALEAFSQL